MPGTLHLDINIHEERYTYYRKSNTKTFIIKDTWTGKETSTIFTEEKSVVLLVKNLREKSKQKGDTPSDEWVIRMVKQRLGMK